MMLNVLVASLPYSGTNALRRALKDRRPLQHPRLSDQMQSLSKSGRDSVAASLAVCLANTTCSVYIDGTDDSSTSSQPPYLRCCDHRLNPPNTSRSHNTPGKAGCRLLGFQRHGGTSFG